jgi:peptidyl-prolyl cis-trans isomerase SurA
MVKRLTCAIFAALLFGVLVHADNIVDEIIARVNDSIITRSDFEKAKEADLKELQQQSPGDWQGKWGQREKEVLRGLIDRQLLLDKGKELGITGETETIKRLDKMRKDMNLPTMDALEEEAKKQGISFEDFKEQIRAGVVAEQVIGQEVGGKLHLSTEETQQWYNKHQKELEGPEEISLSEILVSIKPASAGPDKAQPDADNKAGAAAAAPAEDPAKVAEAEARANGLLAKLRKGEKFEDVAKQNSDGPTAAQGGYLGDFKRGELAKDYEDKTFSLKVGSYTDPIHTRQGFIILKVNAHRAAGVPPYKEVEDQIKQMLYSERLEPAARNYLTKLREESYIEIKPGYVDTGASPNQSSKPEVLAPGAAPGDSKGTSHTKKKKKKFLIF